MDVIDKIEQDFSIRITGETVAFFNQLTFNLGIIFNDAIVDHAQFPITGSMRVGVTVTWFSVSGPTGMADANIGVKVFANQGIFQVSDFALLFIYFKAAVQKSDAGAVISPVF